MIVQHIARLSGGIELRQPMRFVPHRGTARPRRQAEPGSLDRFAELLAEGLTVAEAAKRMGVTYEYGNAMLQRIRKRLGGQAR